MRILAFHFVDDDAANAASRDLSTNLDGSDWDIQKAAVVVDGLDGTLLGLVVDNEARPVVVDVVTSRGGRLVADVPEEWTDRPRE